MGLFVCQLAVPAETPLPDDLKRRLRELLAQALIADYRSAPPLEPAASPSEESTNHEKK